MSELDKDIQELHAKTALTRYQFLRAELQTCFTALDMAEHELSVGNTAVAHKETTVVERALQVFARFLPELADKPRKELETRVAELKTKLEETKTHLRTR